MSLQDYAVKNDHFKLRDDGTIAVNVEFPCCKCDNRNCLETEPPCRGCGHMLKTKTEKSKTWWTVDWESERLGECSVASSISADDAMAKTQPYFKNYPPNQTYRLVEHIEVEKTLAVFTSRTITKIDG